MADFSLEAELKANASQFISELKKGESSIGSLGNVVEKILGPKGKLVLAIAAATTAALKFGQAMNSSMAEIAKGTGATGEQLHKFRDNVQDALVNGAARSAQEVGAMMADLNTRLGVTGDELTSLTVLFEQFSSITGTDTKTAINLTADAMAKWDIETEKTEGLLNQLTLASQESGLSVEELLNGLKEGQVTLSQFGMSATDSIAFMATLKKRGIESSQALVAMKIALANFSKQGINAEKGFKKVVESIQNATSQTEALSIATEVFGTRNGAEMVKVLQSGALSAEDFKNRLMEAGDAIEKTDNASRTSKDALEDLAAELKGTFGGIGQGLDGLFKGLIDSITRIMKVLDPIIRPIFNIFREILTFVGDLTSELTDTVADFTEVQPGYVSFTQALQDAYETVHTILSNMLEVFKDAFGLIYNILTGHWYTAWLYAQQIVANAAKFILDLVSDFINTFKNQINAVIKSVINPLIEKLNWIQDKLHLEKTEKMEPIGDIELSKITGLEDIIENIGKKIKEVSKQSKKEIVGDLGDVKNAIEETGASTEDATGEVIEAVATKAETTEITLQNIVNVVQSVGVASQSVFGTIVSVATKVISTIANVVKSVLTAILNFAKKIVSSVKNILTKLFDFNIDDALDTLLEFEDSVLTFFVETLPNLPNFFAQAINSVVVLLDNVLNILSNTNITELLIGSLDIVLTHLPKIMSNIQTVIMNLITSLYDTFMAYSDRIVDTVGDIILNIVKAIPSVLGMVINVFAEIISEVSEYLINHASDILNVLINVVKTVITGIAQFLMNGGWEKMLNALLMLQQVLEEVVSAALPILVSLFEKMLPSVVKVLQKSIKSAAKTFNKLLPSLIKILRMVIEALIDVLLEPEYWDYVNDAIVEIVTGILENIFPIIGNFIGKLFPFILSAVKNIIAGTFEIIGTLIGDIYDAIINMFNKIYDALPSWLQDIIDAIGSVITAIGDVFKEMWDGIVDFIGSFPNAIGNAFNSIVSVITNVCGTIKKVFEWLFDGIEDAFFGIWNGIYRAIQEVIVGINWIFAKISDIGSAIWSGILDVFGFATGTESAPRGLALVGEAGPELIRFNGGEQVLNTKNTQKALSEATGGGGNTWNVTFNNLQDTSAYTMIRELKEYNRKLAINNIL